MTVGVWISGRGTVHAVESLEARHSRCGRDGQDGSMPLSCRPGFIPDEVFDWPVPRAEDWRLDEMDQHGVTLALCSHCRQET